jgi:histidinol-phosphate aminotransferase
MTKATPAPAVRLRATLDSIPRYVAGKPAAEQPGRTTYKISSNENPYPPLPSVLEVVREAMLDLNRYPDMGTVALREAIADRFGVHADEVATGTGSVGLLGTLLQITCDPGDEVVYAWRSFEAYPIVVGLAGATGVQVPLDGEARHDLSAMADAITERTRLIVVCTPNNPTGPALHADALRRFVDAVPPEVLVVLDEAYREFVRDPEVPDCLEFAGELWAAGRDNIAVLRTFSKAYGLAGLRVGYCVAAPAVADALRKVYTPFGVNSVAQIAAIASLDAEPELLARCERIVGERTRVRDALLAQGYEVPPSEANFVWLPLGERTAAFNEHCLAHKVIVRAFADNGARVTIGEPAENDAFLAAASTFDR